MGKTSYCLGVVYTSQCIDTELLVECLGSTPDRLWFSLFSYTVCTGLSKHLGDSVVMVVC